MNDSISRAFVLSGLDALRPVKPKGPESVMETVNRSAWDCALNCAEAVVRTAPPQPEIVRCKDCKWYREGVHLSPNKFCYRLRDSSGKRIGYNFAEDDFCSYGEMRDDVRNP